jgi:hypothetical protein
MRYVVIMCNNLSDEAEQTDFRRIIRIFKIKLGPRSWHLNSQLYAIFHLQKLPPNPRSVCSLLRNVNAFILRLLLNPPLPLPRVTLCHEVRAQTVSLTWPSTLFPILSPFMLTRASIATFITTYQSINTQIDHRHIPFIPFHSWSLHTYMNFAIMLDHSAIFCTYYRHS